MPLGLEKGCLIEMKPIFAKGLFILLLLVLVGAGVSHVTKHFIDYPVYETAALKVLKGDVSNLYDLKRNIPGGYYYPYFFALAFSPFAAMGNVLGKWSFLVLFFCCYAFVLAFSLKMAKSFSSIGSIYGFLSVLILLSTYSFNDALMNANIGLILLALCIAAYKVSDRSWFLASLFMAVAISFKIYPVIVLCYFVWRKDWKLVLMTCLLTCGLMYGLPILIYGFNRGVELASNQYFVLSHFGNHWPYDSHVFQNIPATAMRLAELVHLNKSKAFDLSFGLSGILILAFFCKSFLTRRTENAKGFQDRMFVISLALVPMFVPVSWYNMGLFYLPLLGCVVAESFEKKERFNTICLTAYVLFYCLCTPDIIGRPLNYWLAFRGFPFWGVFLIALAFGRQTWLNYQEKFILGKTIT